MTFPFRVNQPRPRGPVTSLVKTRVTRKFHTSIFVNELYVRSLVFVVGRIQTIFQIWFSFIHLPRLSFSSIPFQVFLPPWVQSSLLLVLLYLQFLLIEGIRGGYYVPLSNWFITIFITIPGFVILYWHIFVFFWYFGYAILGLFFE